MNETIAGNELWRWCLVIDLIVLFFLIGLVGRMLLAGVGSRRWVKHDWLGVLARSQMRPVQWVFLAMGASAGFQVLALSERASGLVRNGVSLLHVLAFGYAAYALVDVVDHHMRRIYRKTDSKMDDMLIPLTRKSLRLIVLVFVALQIVQALSDKPIASVLAGVGVVGLAVSLAGQETIKNFFGSIVILADKPFEIGDRIVVGGQDGEVEHVGFRSTRIRMLSGSLLTVPNSRMADEMIENLGKRASIKRVANLTITYDTTPEKVGRAIAIVEEILKDHEGMDPEFPPRVFFNEFNDVSLNLMVTYWYFPADNWRYLAFTDRVNREILRRFGEEGIEFAFPTQTVYLAGDPRRPLPALR